MKLGINFRKLNVYYFNIFRFCDSSVTLSHWNPERAAFFHCLVLMLIEFSMEWGTPHIPACSSVIVFCTVILAIHKSISNETNLDYSSSNQADWKYLWFQQWKLLLYFYDAITDHLPSMHILFFPLPCKKVLALDGMCYAV